MFYNYERAIDLLRFYDINTSANIAAENDYYAYIELFDFLTNFINQD